MNQIPRPAVSCLVGALLELQLKEEEEVDVFDSILNKLSRKTGDADGTQWRDRLRRYEAAGWQKLKIPLNSPSKITTETIKTHFGESLEVLTAKYFEIHQHLGDSFGPPEVANFGSYEVEKVLISNITQGEPGIGMNAAMTVKTPPANRSLEERVNSWMVSDNGVDVALIARKKSGESGPETAIVLIQCKAKSDPDNLHLEKIKEFKLAVNRHKSELEDCKYLPNKVRLEGWLVSNIRAAPSGFTLGNESAEGVIDYQAGKLFKFVQPSLTPHDAKRILNYLCTGERKVDKYAAEYSWDAIRFDTYKDKPLQAEVYTKAKAAIVPALKQITTNETLEDGCKDFVYYNDELNLQSVRCQLIAACGCGKTLMTAKLAMVLNAKRSIFVAPLVTLVVQTAKEWANVFADAVLPVEGGAPLRLKYEIATFASVSKHQLEHKKKNGEPLPSKLVGIELKKTATEALKWLFDPKAEKGSHRILVATYASMGRGGGGGLYDEALNYFQENKNNNLVDFLVLDEAHLTAGPLYGLSASDGNEVLLCKGAAHLFPTRVKISVTATPRIHPGSDRLEGNKFFGFTYNGKDISEDERSIMGDDATPDASSNYDAEKFACQNDKTGFFGPVLVHISLKKALNARIIVGSRLYVMNPERDSFDTTNEDLLSQLAKVTSYTDFSCGMDGCKYCCSRAKQKESEEERVIGLPEAVRQKRSEITMRAVAALSQVLHHVATGKISKVVAYSKNVQDAEQLADIAHLLSIQISKDLKAYTSDCLFKSREKSFYDNKVKRNKAILRLEKFSANCATVSYKDKGKSKIKIDIFEEAECGLITNNRIMIIGQDVKCIDGILFMDRISSVGMFVQAMGRGMRTFKGKTCCNVFLAALKNVFKYDEEVADVPNVSKDVEAAKNCIECLEEALLVDSSDDIAKFGFAVDVYQALFGKDGDDVADAMKALTVTLKERKEKEQKDPSADNLDHPDYLDPSRQDGDGLTADQYTPYLCEGSCLFKTMVDGLVSELDASLPGTSSYDAAGPSIPTSPDPAVTAVTPRKYTFKISTRGDLTLPKGTPPEEKKNYATKLKKEIIEAMRKLSTDERTAKPIGKKNQTFVMEKEVPAKGYKELTELLNPSPTAKVKITRHKNDKKSYQLVIDRARCTGAYKLSITRKDAEEIFLKEDLDKLDEVMNSAGGAEEIEPDLVASGGAEEIEPDLVASAVQAHLENPNILGIPAAAAILNEQVGTINAANPMKTG